MANPTDSRKYKMAKLVIFIATAMATIPPIVTTLFKMPVLMLLSGSEWAGIVGSCFLFYGAANVAELHVSTKSAQLNAQEPEGK
jgi:hypothetical protein